MPADTDLLEPDQLAGTPHPREQTAFFGHGEAEAAFLDALAAGRLHHAWLIGGPEGIGKATLAYRVARFLLAHGGAAPAGARDARGRSATPGGAAGRGPLPSRSRDRPARPAQGRQGLFARRSPSTTSAARSTFSPRRPGRAAIASASSTPPTTSTRRAATRSSRSSRSRRRARSSSSSATRRSASCRRSARAAASCCCGPWATPISPPSSARSDRRSPTRRTPI